MKFFNTCAILATLSSLSLAAPTASGDASRQYFQLITETIEPHTKYGGLYVIPQHTYAGGNTVVLSQRPEGVAAFLNGTKLVFDLGGESKKGYLLYPVDFALVDVTAGWGYETANAGNTGKFTSFEITQDGYLRNSIYVDHGKFNWRGCVWWHGVPELFWNNPYATDNPNPDIVPENCSLLNVKVKYLKS